MRQLSAQVTKCVSGLGHALEQAHLNHGSHLICNFLALCNPSRSYHVNAPIRASAGSYGRAQGCAGNAGKVAESLAAMGVLVNPIYITENIVVFIYNEEAFSSSLDSARRAILGEGPSTPQKRLKMRGTSSRSSAPASPMGSASPLADLAARPPPSRVSRRLIDDGPGDTQRCFA